jgi:thiamine-monophosphate kinase
LNFAQKYRKELVYANDICREMTKESENKTPLHALGEAGIHQRIRECRIPSRSETYLGPGDDAAIVRPKQGQELVVTKDMLVEGVHFDLMYCPLHHLGYKAVSANVSDVVGMGAEPAHIVLGLGLPPKFTVEALDAFMEGVRHACVRYGIDLIGGDTVSTLSDFFISITAIGYVETGKSIVQSGARKNDLLCVSGNLGAAYAGFLMLDRERRIFLENPEVQPDLTDHTYVLERQLRPEARTDIWEQLKQAGIRPTAMTDVSDGLSKSCFMIGRASGLGVRIDLERLPIHPGTLKVAEELNMDPYHLALHGGEEYELLFTVPMDAYAELQKIENITVVGFMEEDPEAFRMIDSSGKAFPMQERGWDGFEN